MNDLKALESIDRKLTAVLSLLALSAYGNQEATPKPEAHLYAAGLSAQEIATILGKQVGAVRKALQRAK